MRARRQRDGRRLSRPTPREELGNIDGATLNSSDRQEIVAALKRSQTYRDSFVEGQIKTAFSFQLRALRRARGWTQSRLGELAGIAQEVVSRHENAGYTGLTLKSALKLASALRVGLVMHFVPYSDVVDRALNLTPQDMLVPPIEKDTRLDEPFPGLALVLPPAARQPSETHAGVDRYLADPQQQPREEGNQQRDPSLRTLHSLVEAPA